MMQLVLVDDEPEILSALARSLHTENYSLALFDKPEQALAHIQSATVDLIVSDYRMPHIDGISLLTSAKQIQPDSLRIIMSGNADRAFLEDAINKAEIYRFISKPWDAYEFKITLQQALKVRHLQLENRRLADQVRAQRDQIKRQQSELERLEQHDPGITQVVRDQDGAILLETNKL